MRPDTITIPYLSNEIDERLTNRASIGFPSFQFTLQHYIVLRPFLYHWASGQQFIALQNINVIWFSSTSCQTQLPVQTFHQQKWDDWFIKRCPSIANWPQIVTVSEYMNDLNMPQHDTDIKIGAFMILTSYVISTLFHVISIFPPHRIHLIAFTGTIERPPPLSVPKTKLSSLAKCDVPRILGCIRVEEGPAICFQICTCRNSMACIGLFPNSLELWHTAKIS